MKLTPAVPSRFRIELPGQPELCAELKDGGRLEEDADEGDVGLVGVVLRRLVHEDGPVAVVLRIGKL